jgi:hypothetical protein
VSDQKLGEWEGAMAPRWNQVVLSVGREQDLVNTCMVGAGSFLMILLSLSICSSIAGELSNNFQTL